MKKKKAQQIHFFHRCLQRIGFVLDENNLIKKIQSGELDFIKRQSNRVTIWRYYVKDKSYQVVYDKVRKQVITVLEEG